MSGVLYEEEYIGLFLLVTVFMGGGAAWLSGRAIAGAWHPPWGVAIVALLLGAATRFIHFALFHGDLLSAPSYACDTLFLFIVGIIAWRATRTSQMVRQYPWLYVRAGPLQWRQVVREESPPQ